MAKKKKENVVSHIDEAIVLALEDQKELNAYCDEYETISKNVERLAKAKAEIEANNRKKLSPDTILTVGAYLGATLLVLNYEELHCFTSKAMQFMLKPKL